jgi:glycosyltransferase involved in cell wall biosynthesis
LRITFYERAPSPGGYSIERIFADVRSALPSEIESTVFRLRFGGTSPLSIASNLLSASANEGQLNHITGAVHYLAMALDPQKTILTIHDCGHLSHFSGIRYLALRKLWYEIPVNRSRVVTVVSSATADDLCSLVPGAAKKIRVIHNPVGEGFQQVPKQCDPANPVILQVGTRRANKNLERVTWALEGIPCTLDIVGPLDDNQRSELRRLGISFRNFVALEEHELVARYIESDVVIVASTFEGFGMPIIEAQAVGRPVITSDVAPLKDVAGPGACCVNPYSVTEIRNAIKRVIQDEGYRNELVGQGLDNVIRFSLKSITRQYLDTYLEVAGS